jgi:hypothetical protein
MATSDNITPEQIDEEYPVAGQDNDSQGFRDNFAAIQSSLSATKTALQDLESKAVVKVALSDTTIDNNLQGNILANAVLQRVGEEQLDNGNIDTNEKGNILWSSAQYHKMAMGNPSSVRLNLGGWPESGVYAKMRLAIYSNDGSERTLTFEAANAGTLRVNQENWNAALDNGDFKVVSATSPKVVDVWTVDGGITVFMEYKGQFSILS